MAMRTLICFPAGTAPGLRAEAAQLALGLTASGHDVMALGPLGAWRHALRMAKIAATEFSFPGDARKITQAIHDFEPQIIHAFGAEAAHLTLPQTMLVGAGGVATLGHQDLAQLNPAQFRTASTIYVPCEYLREQMTRRLPSVPVVVSGYLLPPAETILLARNRFLAEELGIQDDMPLILLADAFHGSETSVALTLIAAMPLLVEHLYGIQAVIAGDGIRLSELEAAAVEINNQLGYRALLLPGQRDDIVQLLALAHVAVGSGRFAMEAIGAGVATVCAGAAGMVGAFTEDTARQVEASCAGRHGRLEPLTPRALATEIHGLFRYPQLRATFATEGQTAMLAVAERTQRAEQISTYYSRTSPSGVVAESPQHIAILLPDILRELLFVLPAINGLRAQHPLARLLLITSPVHQQLLERLGLAERVVVRPHTPAEWWALLRALARPRNHACLVYPNTLAATLIAGLSLAPQRIGFAGGWTSMIFTDSVPLPAHPSPEEGLSLMHALGVSVGKALPPPTIPPEVAEMVNVSLLGQNIEYTDPVLLCCPAAEPGWGWPRAHWETLLRRLAAECPERIAVLDAANLDLPEGVAPVAPVRNSLVLAALLARAAVVIAPDCGALHLATLLGVPAIGLYGPTSPDTSRLPGETLHPLCHREYPCHPCVDEVCTERHCLHALTPDEVCAALEQLRAACRV